MQCTYLQVKNCIFWSIIQTFTWGSVTCNRWIFLFIVVYDKNKNKGITFLLSNEILKFLCHFGDLVGAEGIYILTSYTIKHKWMKIESRWSTTTEIKNKKPNSERRYLFSETESAEWRKENAHDINCRLKYKCRFKLLMELNIN